MEAFGLDPLKILIYLILTIVLYIVLDKFVLSALTKSLDERRSQIDKNMATTKDLETKMTNLELEVSKKFEEVSKETDKILESSRKEGLTQRSEIVSKANLEAKGIVEAAVKRLDQERADLKATMNSQVEVAVKKAVEELWSERMEKVDPKLIDQAIKKI
jgi:F-type H+-transporting ATPase subunit b